MIYKTGAKMKILLGISGGVDSAYAALKLKNEGHTVEGAVIKMHEHTEISAAKEVAESIGIPLHIIDASEAFDRIIKENFASEYIKGRTPNPCIICNPEVKFKSLYDYACQAGFDMIATGHYAKIVKIDTNGEIRYTLASPTDERKDQTYMLYRLPQNILAKTVFPLSDICKDQVRELSRDASLVAADRGDSQEICFLPDGDYPSFVEAKYGKSKHGNFIGDNGEVLGEHKGIIHYTVGQRKGLGIALGSRAFVTEIDPEKNTVRLSTEPKKSNEIFITDIVYTGLPKPDSDLEIEAMVKPRYTAKKIRATVVFHGDNTANVIFSEPTTAAPGQSLTIYNEEGLLLAGGFIN
jgi:tRNA-specific 2-thiouridylase